MSGQLGGHELYAPSERAARAAREGVGVVAAVGEGVAGGRRGGVVVFKDAANQRRERKYQKKMFQRSKKNAKTSQKKPFYYKRISNESKLKVNVVK